MGKEDAETIQVWSAGQNVGRSHTTPSLPREGEPSERFHSGIWSRISISKLKSEIATLQLKIAPMLGDLKKSAAGAVELTEVTVGLTISAEGDIGIVSAGAEPSLELTFKVK